MRWILFVIPVLLLLLLLFLPSSVMAYASHQSTPCTISIHGEIIPVSWNNETRGNPDGTFYPGDGLHFLFKFKGSNTCQGFSAESLKSNGAVDVLSHYVIKGLNHNVIQENIHSHDDLDQVPKYLMTTHYYKILNREPYTLSENPVVSVREDQTITRFQENKITDYKGNLSTDIKIIETKSWGFTKMGVNHKHGNDEHAYEDKNSIKLFENSIKESCSNLAVNQGCVFGHAEINTDIVKTKCLLEELFQMKVKHDVKDDICVNITDELSLTVKGAKIVCNNEKCKSVIVKKLKQLTPNILSPDFEIILSDPPVKDRDNYNGKNKDGTYYPHDPIGIIHNPSLLWKDYRAGTIQFETTKVYKLSNEYEYDCNSNSCEHKIELDSVYPVSYNFRNGQGITIYNTTSVYFGLHSFDYTTTATNLNNVISTTQNSMQVKVVDYFPQYTSYPYPLLYDNKELAFDDRQAVALYYVGSVEGDQTFEKRRSKINYLYNVDVGYDPWTPHVIIQNFTLSEGITVTDGVLEFHNNTVVFSESGYGKIYFEHPLGNMIIPDGMAKFENVTSYTTMISNDFAAKDTLAEFYTMRYPEASFTKNLTIKSVNQNGTIMNNDIIQLEVKPYEKINTEYITSYIYDKILFDSDDETFAEIISGDTYPMEQKYSGTGMINATISKTSVFFDEYIQQTNNVNATFSESVINDLTSLLDSPDTIRLAAPYDMGLSALSPTTLHITVNNITDIMDERYYSFGGKQTILVNTQTDNILHANRDKNKIVIYPHENFGLIDTVYINDILVEQECQSGCVVLFPPEEEIILSAHNKWGGIASITLPEIIIPEIPISDEPNYMVILAIVILLMLLYIGYKKIRLN